MSEIVRYKVKRYFFAECECGWSEDGSGEEERARVERARAKHALSCPKSITRLTSSKTTVHRPKDRS